MVKHSDSDKVTVVGAGVTLFEALAAYEKLKAEGIMIRVVDPFTLKPIDKDTLVECAKATGGKVVTVEDHYPEGTEGRGGRRGGCHGEGRGGCHGEGRGGCHGEGGEGVTE